MLASMTGFTRTTIQGIWGQASWEIRSVNHRYLELSLRVPDALGSLENRLRETARQYLQRGKVDCVLKLQITKMADRNLVVDHLYAEQLIAAHQELIRDIPDVAPLNMMAILQWPGVVIVQQADLAELHEQLYEGFVSALQDLLAVRQREGRAIKDIIQQRLNGMLALVKPMQNRWPEFLELQRDKIRERFAAAQVELDPTRFEQEMVLYAQKIDIAEELDRLQLHLTELQRLLDQGGAQGRRLDFLLQELNREANTLGSKANSLEVTNAAVELKVLLEQIREQIQNLE